MRESTNEMIALFHEFSQKEGLPPSLDTPLP